MFCCNNVNSLVLVFIVYKQLSLKNYSEFAVLCTWTHLKFSEENLIAVGKTLFISICVHNIALVAQNERNPVNKGVQRNSGFWILAAHEYLVCSFSDSVYILIFLWTDVQIFVQFIFVDTVVWMSSHKDGLVSFLVEHAPSKVFLNQKNRHNFGISLHRALV